MKEKVILNRAFFLLLTMTAFISVSLAGCDAFDPYGGGFKTYTDPNKKFQVEIPKKYDFKVSSTHEMIDRISLELRQYEALGYGDVREFSVHVFKGIYGHVKDRMSVDEFQDQMAAGIAEGVFADKKGKLISQDYVERAGVTTPTLKLKLKHHGKDYWGILDVYVYGDDLFLYGVSGLSPDIGSDKDAVYFLESFTIPD